MQLEKAKVTYRYDAEQDDELPLEVGDIIEVLDRNHSEGWWQGRINDKTGVFPNNFVELIPPEATKTPLPLKPASLKSATNRPTDTEQQDINRKPSMKGLSSLLNKPA
ncbi:SH3 domain-containing protein, partial [Salmonella sp. s51228]|uniref:SH3 domain-containing protein n=1 Tax=Salmonella sp. s51228 TaxID=3159652 RepID=UPI00397F1803